MTVISWIDWYAYHHAKFRALMNHPGFGGRIAGIEMVGKGKKTRAHKAVVHRDAPLTTLLPNAEWNLWTQSRLTLLLWRKLNQLNPDTVLVPVYQTLPGLAMALWGRLHSRQTILMAESSHHDVPRSSWRQKARRWLLGSLFDSAILGGRADRRHLAKLGFNAEREGVSYDVVDNEFFASEAQRWQRLGENPLGRPYFLYVGRLAREKNLDTLIEAFAEYRRNGGDWDLMIVGDGPAEPSLRALVAHLGLIGKVYFVGAKPVRDLPRYYAFASCFVLPSKCEPWGLVVNEAMASGLPVIVSKPCGCCEQLVEDGTNGYSFHPERTDELERCLTTMAALPEPQRRRMAQSSQAKVGNYSPARWAEEVARLAAPESASCC